MSGLKVMLFGIALICFSGLFVVGQALGNISESLFSWGMFAGLLLSFLGLLMDDRSRSDGGGTASGETDGGGDDSESEADDLDGSEADDPDGSEDEGSAERDRYYANRFPPM